jgi:hypothetical protein
VKLVYNLVELKVFEERYQKGAEMCKKKVQLTIRIITYDNLLTHVIVEQLDKRGEWRNTGRGNSGLPFGSKTQKFGFVVDNLQERIRRVNFAEKASKSRRRLENSCQN